MAVTFPRTLRSLNRDRYLWRITALSLVFILPLVLFWFFWAEISVYEAAVSARLEAVPQNVAAEVEGRIVASNLQIGLSVTEGEELVVLDGESILKLMEETNQQILSAVAGIEACQQEIEVKQQSLLAHANARELAILESQKLQTVAESRARSAQESFQRVAALAAKNQVSDEEQQKARSEAEVAEAMFETAKLAVARGEQDRLAEEQRQKADLASVRRELSDLKGELATQNAVLERRHFELKLRTIRAYVSGRVEEVLPLRVGSIVKPSEKLATIVPFGVPRVVAFLPVVAVGRVVAGQPARLRMDGFPWTQYGTLAATVTAVGNEPADGLIRVELDITADTNSRIPLQHGQTASVEIVVERATPATLVLRAAGDFLMTQRVLSSSK